VSFSKRQGAGASGADHVAALLRSGDERAIRLLASSFGREMAALAYVVLQNRQDAQRSTTRAMADAVEQSRSVGWPRDGAELLAHLESRVLRHALAVHTTSREVDVRPGGPGTSLPLSPRQRAVTAAHGTRIPFSVLAGELGVPVQRLTAELRSAQATAGSPEALDAWLAVQDMGVAFDVPESSLRAALAARPSLDHRLSPKWLLAAPGAVLVVAIALLVSAPPTGVPAWQVGNGGPPGATGSASLGAGTDSPPVAAPMEPASLTLADCNIQPAGSPLAYRGWLTLRDLTASATPDGAGLPVYALVTRSTAEWVGWQTPEGRPMFPRPVGRLGCALDPTTSVITVYVLSERWRPPRLVDGCAASPISQYGGNREIGGPRAFTLLPLPGQSWWANDPSVEILVRIAPSPSPEAHITAQARPMGFGKPIELEVESLPFPASRSRTSNHYVTLRSVVFPTDGCWVLSVAVDGEVAGFAVLPVTRHTDQRQRVVGRCPETFTQLALYGRRWWANVATPSSCRS
jgi:hypothetical protein